MRTRRLRALIALILSLSLLCACSAGNQNADFAAEVQLPEPPAIDDRQIIGERLPEREWEVRLCYPSESGAALGSVAQVFYADNRIDLMRDVFTALFSSEAYRYASRAGLGDIRLLDVEYSRGIAVLNLSIEASVHPSQQDYLNMCAAIVNTYLDIDGVDAVSILIANRSDSLYAMPMGVFTEPIDNLTNAVAKLQTEQSRYTGAHGDPIIRTAALYYPANGQRRFVPELRSIRFSEDNLIQAVIEAIAAGTEYPACAASPIPENLNLLSAAPAVTVTGDGQHIAETSISDKAINYMALSGFDLWQLYGSIVLSVTGFVPELDGVRFSLASAQVDLLQIGQREIRFENAVMRRDDFSDLIGGTAQMIFADADGNLMQMECALSQYAALSPMRTLQAMIDLPTQNAELRSAFPAEITASDVLGVEISDDAATVNLSANFYAACQQADDAQERNIVYAIVNAVCAFDSVRTVQILIEGRSIDTLSHNVYLRQPLIDDPGMVLSHTASSATAPDESLAPASTN